MGKNNLMMADTEKAKTFHAFFASVFTGKACSQISHTPAWKQWRATWLVTADVFKSMGPSGIQPRVLKEMTGTLSTIFEKNVYWVRSLMIGKKGNNMPIFKKNKNPENYILISLPPSPANT